MKKIIALIIVVFGIAIASVAIAYKVVELESYQYSAQIANNGANTRIYTVSLDKATCYVSVTVTNGVTSAPSLSCVK